jgi:hypothetical protein
MAIGKYGPHVREQTYIAHAYSEQLFGTGEIALNYAIAGSPHLPALLLIPGQTESWWGYEPDGPAERQFPRSCGRSARPGPLEPDSRALD